MAKKKKRPVKYLIISIFLLILGLIVLVGGIISSIFVIITINLIAGILLLLVIIYCSFTCLVHGLSYLQISWAMRLTMNTFFRADFS